ncbi:MAG: MFS transporter, partial [Acidimicrobiales bacterium]
TNVGTYVAAALLLGVFFAMQSGTTDSIVYDTVVEETGASEQFERTIGRLRLFESVALVTGALAGGGLAAVTSTRLTYFVTVPLVAASVPVLLRFREPTLHESDGSESLRSQVATTYRTILNRGCIRPVMVAMVLSSVLLQSILEFGPLWMVALAAPAFLYGPHWAGLMAGLGLGGTLGGRLRFSDPATLATVVAVMLGCSIALVTSHHTGVVIGSQVILALLVVAVSIYLTKLLHDAVPSTIRAGVASGVGTLTWMAFLPFALGFGYVSKHAGVHVGGWLMVLTTAVTSASVVTLALSRGPDSLPCRPNPSPLEPTAAAARV